MTSCLWMWWQGYVTVRLRGPGLERLLNKVADLGIAVFGVERLTTDVVIVRLGVKDFRRLRPLLWGSQINVSILDRHGAPFVLRRFRMRAFLGVGLVLSLSFSIYLANFIWFIELHGNESLSMSALKVALEDLGLRSGVPRSSVQPREIEAELMERFPILAWAQVSVQGVKAEIQITERDGVDSEYGGAGHIYAQTDGVVTELLVLRGTPRVKEGDTVRKEDLLISGVYYDARGRRQFGAARGIVKARVWYEGVGEATLTKWEAVKTGRAHRQYVLTIGAIHIPLGRSYPQETHLPDSKEWRLSLGSAMVPLRFAKTDYQEVEYVPVRVSTEEAQAVAYGIAWESLAQQGVQQDGVLKEKHRVDFMPDGDGLRVTVWVEVVEDIGQFFSQ